MTSTTNSNLHNSLHLTLLTLLLLVRSRSFGLNSDGLLLLSFKFDIITDPFRALQSWNYQDETPCSWNGVVCEILLEQTGQAWFRVTGLSLPNFGLSGSIPSSVGMIEHLRNLNLANNSLQGAIPSTLFSTPELTTLDLSSNLLSGELPESVGKLQSLRELNLSGNGLNGRLPVDLTALRNLTSVSLKNNLFFGQVPGGFDSVRALDLSYNFFDGPLPPDFGGGGIVYLNASFNRFSGEITAEFAARIPENATLDLSFNNLTGPIPASDLFRNQDTTSFFGNPGLCGKPLENPCSAAAPPDSPPAIAVIPKSETAEAPSAAGNPVRRGKSGLKTGAILGIVAGDIVGIVIVAVVFGCVYNNQMKKRRNRNATNNEAEGFDWASSEIHSRPRTWADCLKRQKRPSGGSDDEDETSSESSESEIIEVKAEAAAETAALVTVDGGKEIESEALLKASAYILGASGSSIMYKAVLEDGSTLAVRRVGENGLDRLSDFENRVRVIGKMKHPNLVRVRGFYWGAEEKLIIYEFVPNGSLANARYRKGGSSPCHLPWDKRLRIAKGVARGLAYIHEKKHVHGNLKPSNILLGLDMEPKIADFGLERLVAPGDNSSKPGGSARNFGSKRSTASRDSLHDLAVGPAALSPSPSSIGLSPYHAPESLRSLKSTPKWDVYAFGVVLLELVTGKVVLSDESGPGLAIGSSVMSAGDDMDKIKVLRIADASIRGEMEGKEDALLALVKLGYNCISHVPQKRPSMKEVVQGLDRFPCSSYGHL